MKDVDHAARVVPKDRGKFLKGLTIGVTPSGASDRRTPRYDLSVLLDADSSCDATVLVVTLIQSKIPRFPDMGPIIPCSEFQLSLFTCVGNLAANH